MTCSFFLVGHCVFGFFRVFHICLTDVYKFVDGQLEMACQLSSCLFCPGSQMVTTQCGHVFHQDCLQRTWSQNCRVCLPCLPCPCCSTKLGQVHLDASGQVLVGIDGGSLWIAYYVIVNNKIEPLQQQFSWWKRHSGRLDKHEPINLRSHIVVS